METPIHSFHESKFECFKLITRLFRVVKQKISLVVSDNHTLLEVANESSKEEQIRRVISEYSLLDIEKLGINWVDNTGILTLTFNDKKKKAQVYEMDASLVTECVVSIKVAMRSAKATTSSVSTKVDIPSTFEGTVLLMQFFYMIVVQMEASFQVSPSIDIILDIANMMSQTVNMKSDIESSTEQHWSESERASVEKDFKATVEFIQAFLHRSDVQEILQSDRSIEMKESPNGNHQLESSLQSLVVSEKMSMEDTSQLMPENCINTEL